MPSRTREDHSMRDENHGRKLASTTRKCSYICTCSFGPSGKTPPSRIALCHFFFVRRASSVSFILIRRRFRKEPGKNKIPRVVCTRKNRAGLTGTQTNARSKGIEHPNSSLMSVQHRISRACATARNTRPSKSVALGIQPPGSAG